MGELLDWSVRASCNSRFNLFHLIPGAQGTDLGEPISDLMLDSFKIRQIHIVYYPLGTMNVGHCLIRKVLSLEK